jgi:hypothetical protein
LKFQLIEKTQGGRKMSNRVLVGCLISEECLDTFREACDLYNIDFNTVTHELRDRETTGHAQLESVELGWYRLRVDTDAHYSPMVKRVGAQLNPVMQKFSELETIRTAELNGWGVQESFRDEKNHLHLRIAV